MFSRNVISDDFLVLALQSSTASMQFAKFLYPLALGQFEPGAHAMSPNDNSSLQISKNLRGVYMDAIQFPKMAPIGPQES